MQKSKEQRALARLGQGMVDGAAHPAAQLAGYLQTGDPTYLPPGPLRRHGRLAGPVPGFADERPGGGGADPGQ